MEYMVKVLFITWKVVCMVLSGRGIRDQSLQGPGVWSVVCGG